MKSQKNKALSKSFELKVYRYASLYLQHRIYERKQQLEFFRTHGFDSAVLEALSSEIDSLSLDFDALVLLEN